MTTLSSWSATVVRSVSLALTVCLLLRLLAEQCFFYKDRLSSPSMLVRMNICDIYRFYRCCRVNKPMHVGYGRYRSYRQKNRSQSC